MAEAPWTTQGQTGPPGVARHKSDVSDRRVEPPLCIQNAMLTKDKKPFTYTPGGIDLSEIRSPRMARRIERNANAPGVGEILRTPPIAAPEGPLPPSALAAMQPALPVQVFPPGPPPPPPPPPAHIPPPPPMEPLPTKSIATVDGVFERPDMTKIIPENPMALLRKTPGVVRRSFVDEQPSPYVQNVDTPQYSQPQIQVQSRPQPQAQVQPRPQPQVQVQSRPQSEIYIQPQYAQPEPKLQVVNTPIATPVQNTRPEVKTSTAQLGSLYIPPLNNVQETQKNTVTPPTPPQRNTQSPAQSPGSPQSPVANLNKAPRPWQNQKPQQQALPPWATKQQSPPPAQPPSPPTPQSPPIQVYQQRQPPSFYKQQPVPQQQVRSPQPQPTQPNIVGRVIIPVQMDAPPNQNNVNVDAVYVTQPVVLQHPGPRPEGNQQTKQQPRVVQRQQSQKTEPKGTRIIPIQIEGNSNANIQRQDSKFSSPATPDSARSFNRQPSWSSAPTQSNSFKVIQKLTNTDGEDDEDQQTIEHSPRNSQHFQQVPTGQVRKINLNDGDRELMNKIKQVPRNSQEGNRTPQVRTIPVHIEGESSGKPYIPPSEQVVQEPKKYTGSAIPSRSFKMLQAMTGSPCGPDQSDM